MCLYSSDLKAKCGTGEHASEHSTLLPGLLPSALGIGWLLQQPIALHTLPISLSLSICVKQQCRRRSHRETPCQGRMGWQLSWEPGTHCTLGMGPVRPDPAPLKKALKPHCCYTDLVPPQTKCMLTLNNTGTGHCDYSRYLWLWKPRNKDERSPGMQNKFMCG